MITISTELFNNLLRAFVYSSSSVYFCCQLFTYCMCIIFDYSILSFGGKIARFAGFADNVGDAFCFKVATGDTEQVIYRSVLRPALDHDNNNKRPTSNHSKKFIDSDTLPTNGESNQDLDKITKSDLVQGEIFGLKMPKKPSE